MNAGKKDDMQSLFKERITSHLGLKWLRLVNSPKHEMKKKKKKKKKNQKKQKKTIHLRSKVDSSK